MCIFNRFGFKGVAADHFCEKRRMVGWGIGLWFHLIKDDPSSPPRNLPACLAPCESGANDSNRFHRPLFYLFSLKFVKQIPGAKIFNLKAASNNVIPAKAGIQKPLKSLDPRLPGSDKLIIIRGSLKL